MKKMTPGNALKHLAGYAIEIGAFNAQKLTGDKPDAWQLSRAITEAQKPGNELYSRGFRLELRSVCLAMGDDPDTRGLKGIGQWDQSDTTYLQRIYRMVSDSNPDKKKRRGAQSSASPEPIAPAEAAQPEAPPAETSEAGGGTEDPDRTRAEATG